MSTDDEAGDRKDTADATHASNEAPAAAKVEEKADAKVEEKADAKAEEKADAKGEEKADAKADAKAEEKADAKGEEKADAKGEEKADAKGEEKAAAKAEEELPHGMAKLDEGEWSEATNPGAKPRDPLRLAPAWRRWAFAVVPLVGVLELGLHVKQTHSVVPESDFAAARAGVQKDLKPDDLVLFAPKWNDPVGRETFGPDIMTLARSARPDETRFARAFEVSIRGEHRPEVASWTRGAEQQYGGVTVTLLTNPSPAALKDDLVRHLTPDQASVFRADPASGMEQPCAWSVGPTASGGVYYPFGPATPGARFNCQGTFAGVSVIQDLEHEPRQCILVPPVGNGGIVRLRFANVAFGASLHGHHGLHYDAERHATGEVVSLVFRSGDRSIGRVEHRIGTGWTGFELSTQELAGQRGELTVDVLSRTQQRQYCFEADTR